MLGEGKRAGRVIPGAIGYVLFNYFLPHCIPLVECPSPYASSTPAHRMTALLSSVPVTTLKLERAWVQIPLEMGCDEGSNLESLNFTGGISQFHRLSARDRTWNLDKKERIETLQALSACQFRSTGFKQAGVLTEGNLRRGIFPAWRF